MRFFYVCFYYLSFYAYANGHSKEESSADSFVSVGSKESHSVENVKVDQNITATPELSNRTISETNTTLLSMKRNESLLVGNTTVDQNITTPEMSSNSLAEAVTSSTESVETFLSAESRSAGSDEKTEVASRHNKTTERNKPTSETVEILISSESENFESFESNEVIEKVTGSASCCNGKTIKGNEISSEESKEKKRSHSNEWKWRAVSEKDYPLGLCPLATNRSRRKTYTCTEDAHCRSMKQICCLGVCEYPLPLGPIPHDGSCLALPVRPVTNATCVHDGQCANDEKCCQNGTEIHCVKASPLRNFNRKPGFCDRVKPDEFMQKYKLCNGDTDCFKMDKCCPTSTTYRCMPPLRLSPKPKRGKCKLQSPYLLPVVVPLCYSDYDCLGVQKCCYDGRQERCMNPHGTLEELD